MVCRKCSKELPDNSKFCNYCGTNQTQKKNRRTLKRPNGSGSAYKLSGRRKCPWVAAITNVYDKEGKSKPLILGYYSTKTEALEMLQRASINKPNEKYNLTVEEVYEEWKEIHFKTIGKDGRDGYKSAWKHIAPISEVKFREVRTAHFQKIIDHLIDEKKSRSTCEKVTQLCNQLSKYAMKNDIIMKNYATFITLPTSTKKEKEIFTDLEIKTLFENADNDTVKIILILIFTGFRIGELFDLKKENVSLEEKYLIGGFKTEAGTNRMVPINTKIETYIDYFYKKSTCDYLISSPSQTQKEVHNFRNREYYPILAQLGISKKSPHSCRHTFASLMSKANVNPEVLQKIIGHADYATTANIYIHKDIEELQKAIDKI